MSDLESLKRVLMATKQKARAMKKSKLEKRMNPEPEPVSPVEMAEEESSQPLEADEKHDEDEDADSLKDAIRELLARS